MCESHDGNAVRMCSTVIKFVSISVHFPITTRHVSKIIARYQPQVGAPHSQMLEGESSHQAVSSSSSHSHFEWLQCISPGDQPLQVQRHQQEQYLGECQLYEQKFPHGSGCEYGCYWGARGHGNDHLRDQRAKISGRVLVERFLREQQEWILGQFANVFTVKRLQWGSCLIEGTQRTKINVYVLMSMYIE